MAGLFVFLQAATGTAPDFWSTFTGALQFGAVCLVGVITYLAQEIRRDVREMKTKVSILWDRYERGGVVAPTGGYRAPNSPNLTERL